MLSCLRTHEKRPRTHLRVCATAPVRADLRRLAAHTSTVSSPLDRPSLTVGNHLIGAFAQRPEASKADGSFGAPKYRRVHRVDPRPLTETSTIDRRSLSAPPPCWPARDNPNSECRLARAAHAQPERAPHRYHFRPHKGRKRRCWYDITVLPWIQEADDRKRK